nr:calcium-activated chloride channel regulator 4A-like [Procambarus clarkii]
METLVKALLVVAAAVGTGQAADISVVDGAYTGLVVALRDDLYPTQCSLYIQHIQSMISSASAVLYNVTNNTLSFGEVTILVPAAASSWPCLDLDIVENTRRLGWTDAHWRVGPSHPLFLDNPWTQQPRGCGEPGDFTYLSENFLSSNSDSVSQGKLLIHEWAKFRWGVFEEYGHLHDPIFPSAYRAQTSSFAPNYCSNNEVSGSFSDQCVQNGKEEDCNFTPDLASDSNVNIESSLLAAPFLGTVVKFCDSSDHDKTVPTKHNVLCDKRSTQEVINQHEDMQQAPGNTVASTTFSVVRASVPGDTIVFVLDYSVTMTDAISRWAFLKDSVIQFIMVKALPQTRVGLVIFDGTLLNSHPLQVLDSVDNKNSLVDIIKNTKIGTTKKDLLIGIQNAAQILQNENGMIVLVTENLEVYPPNPDLVAAAQGHQVWPILYPNDPAFSKQAYQDLADIIPGTPVLIINNTLNNPCPTCGVYQSVDNYAALTENLLQVGGNSLVKVTEDECSPPNCLMKLTVDNSRQYNPDAFIEVLYNFVVNNFIQLNVYDEESIPMNSSQSTSKIYKITNLQNTTYNVNVSRPYAMSSVRCSLLATPNDGMNVQVWSSKGLSNLDYTKDSVPTLFAMVMKDGHHVLYADVTATVTTKDGPKILTLKDNGAGGDTTGYDGVYSAYMVDFSPPENVGIMVTATDNNGTARILSSVLRSAPVLGEQACCGSQLIIPDELLEDPGSFTVSSALQAGKLTGVPPDLLPPAQITDLRSSRDDTNVILSFTAPGDHLDQGTAAYYTMKKQTYQNSSHVYNENITASEAGSLVQHSVTIQECDLFVFTVTAYSSDGNEGKMSNEVHEFFPCTNSKSLTAGAIAGIVIVCLLGVIIIIIIVYLCLKRDEREDLCLWQVLTCRCIKRNKDDPSVYNSPPPNSARRSDVIRGNRTSVTEPIKNISDLYSKPNLDSKRSIRQRKPDEDDGGFGAHRRQNENLQMRGVSDSSSQVSSSNLYTSQRTLPINQVGIPPAAHSPVRGYSPPYGYNNTNQRPQLFMSSSDLKYAGPQDNPAYDGHDDTDNYGDRHIPPRNPRINTQV